MTCGSCSTCCKTWVKLGIITAIVLFAMESFFHGYCMRAVYMENAPLWRPMAEMQALMGVSIVGYLLFGFIYAWIYIKGFEPAKSHIWQGIKYGVIMSLFYVGSNLFLMYPYNPMPDRIYRDWAAIGLVEGIVLGFIIGVLYKPAKATDRL